jgi:eukaryotic-like serine/threonine-protein kinase
MFPKDAPRSTIGDFEVLDHLGVGGAASVYLARSKGGRLVAIKVLSETSDDSGVVEQLAREASLCVRLKHPAIVQVRAFVEDRGVAALVFEYVHGVALGRLLRFLAGNGVRLPDRAGWHVVERVLSALAYAHAQMDDEKNHAPIVHRDVSPSNVLVDWSGDVKLTDFGMAKMLGVSPSTSLGLVKGTLGCMAPEQARGEPVDERADVYAGALLAWRIATGLTPYAKFQDDEIELVRAMRNPHLPPLGQLRGDLPHALIEAIACALQADPRDRTITAEELRNVVRANVDVAEGMTELAELIEGSRESLERTVSRDGERSVSGPASGRAEMTVRYEELALSFDDEGDTQTRMSRVQLDAPLRAYPPMPSPPAKSVQNARKIDTVVPPRPPRPSSGDFSEITRQTQRRQALPLWVLLGIAVTLTLFMVALAWCGSSRGR